jgi:hypothetical protein
MKTPVKARIREFIEDFEVFTARRPSIKQLQNEMKKIASEMTEGNDLFEEHPELFTEPDPVKWGEAVLHDRKGQPLTYWPHHLTFLRSKNKRRAVRGGRDIGKTTVLKTVVLHKGFTQPNKNILIATPKKSHYAKIIALLRKEFRFNPSLARRVEWATDEADNIELRFYNGSVIYFRQGFPDGEAFLGLDADMVAVDEAARMMEIGWKNLDGCLRADGDQEEDIYSNPDGRRNTTYYRRTNGKENRAGQEDMPFELFWWPRWLNPSWNEDLHKKLIEAHGGENTPGYKHEVAGEHGAPEFAAFVEENVLAALVTIEDYALLRITGEEFSDLASSDQSVEREIRSRIEELISVLPERSGVFYLGADLGYTSDPSDLLIDQQRPDGVQVGLVHVHCEHVPYPIMAELIAALDRRYHFAALGIDRGSNGIAVYQDLTGLDKFKSLRLAERLFAFDFGGALLIGYDSDEDGEEDYDKPIKKFAKVHATDLINEALRTHSLLLSDADTAQEDQLIGQTYSLTGSRIVYSKGNDHTVDARRCLHLARWRLCDGIDEAGKETEVSLCFATGGSII